MTGLIILCMSKTKNTIKQPTLAQIRILFFRVLFFSTPL